MDSHFKWADKQSFYVSMYKDQSVELINSPFSELNILFEVFWQTGHSDQLIGPIYEKINNSLSWADSTFMWSDKVSIAELIKLCLDKLKNSRFGELRNSCFRQTDI